MVCTGAQPGTSTRVKRSASLDRSPGVSEGSDSPHPSPGWVKEAREARRRMQEKPKKKRVKRNRVKSKEFVSSDSGSD